MGAIGPRMYLVGQLLPAILRDMATTIDATTAEKLDEAIRVTLYITDLMIARMGKEIVHDWENK